MIYIVSDTHFCHNREFLYKPRGFNSANEMNQAIIKNWNSIVDKDDDVYILGDLMLNNNEEGANCVKRLKGNLHIIIGNHDTDERIKLYKTFYNVKSVEYGARLKYNGYNFFLSHYPTLCSNFDNEKPLKRQVINLCGHSHTQDKWEDWDKGCIYHCELDAHNCAPVSIEQIIFDCQNKGIKF